MTAGQGIEPKATLVESKCTHYFANHAVLNSIILATFSKDYKKQNKSQNTQKTARPLSLWLLTLLKSHKSLKI